MRINLPVDWAKNRGPPPTIGYKQETAASPDKEDKHRDALKIEIKNQPGQADSESISLYIPIFKTGTPEMILKFLVVLKKVIKGQSLTTGPQMYAMTRNLLAGEALRVFNQQASQNGTEPENYYKTTTQRLVKYFFRRNCFNVKNATCVAGYISPGIVR